MVAPLMLFGAIYHECTCKVSVLVSTHLSLIYATHNGNVDVMNERKSP
jgi:hypothetical protein